MPSARSEAAISFNAEFFAPPTRRVPVSGFPPVTVSRSIGLSELGSSRKVDDGPALGCCSDGLSGDITGSLPRDTCSEVQQTKARTAAVASMATPTVTTNGA